MLISWYRTKDIHLTTKKNLHTKVYKKSQIFIIYDTIVKTIFLQPRNGVMLTNSSWLLAFSFPELVFQNWKCLTHLPQSKLLAVFHVFHHFILRLITLQPLCRILVCLSLCESVFTHRKESESEIALIFCLTLNNLPFQYQAKRSISNLGSCFYNPWDE